MAASIWKGSSSSDARNKYIELASKYKQKHGSLSGFLAEHGALFLDGNLHKVRVSGDRFKLANLWKYNDYQALRSSRQGYNNIRADLKKLGVSEAEIDDFIAKDNQLYKSKVQQIPPGDTKGHIKSLNSGGRDGSWNIESEPASDNYSKKSKSPSSLALLAEGVPRNTKEAFIRSKDSSGLPDPSDFSDAERQQLRTLATADEVDDFLAKKYRPDSVVDVQRTNHLIEKSKVHAARLARRVAPGPASVIPGLVTTGLQIRDTIANPTPANIRNSFFDAANSLADIGGLHPLTAAPSEAIQRALDIGQMGANANDQLQSLQINPPS